MSEGGVERRFSGRVAVVTGGTVGIGRAVCRELGAAGAHVVVIGRSRQRIEETLADLGGAASAPSPLGLALDVRSEPDMAEMARRTVERFGRIDVLVASAGILRAQGRVMRTLAQMRVDEWDEVLDTNLKGIYLSNRAVLPAMIAQRSGHIINLSSTSGRKGYAFDTAYCASKFGIIGLSESLADEVRPYGIKVEVLLPGPIATSMWDQNGPFRRPDYALPAERVAALVLHMLALPSDTTLIEPAIDPSRKPGKEGWQGAGAGRAAERGACVPAGRGEAE